MSRFQHRDTDSNNTALWAGVAGALAGFAIGMWVSDRVGGLRGLKSRVRDTLEGLNDDGPESQPHEEVLEERVLEAFRNDPTLAERAIDIEFVSDGVIELTGAVEDEREAHHAVTIARGVPGVDTVVNRIADHVVPRSGP